VGPCSAASTGAATATIITEIPAANGESVSPQGIKGRAAVPLTGRPAACCAAGRAGW